MTRILSIALALASIATAQGASAQIVLTEQGKFQSQGTELSVRSSSEGNVVLVALGTKDTLRLDFDPGYVKQWMDAARTLVAHNFTPYGADVMEQNSENLLSVGKGKLRIRIHSFGNRAYYSFVLTAPGRDGREMALTTSGPGAKIVLETIDRAAIAATRK